MRGTRIILTALAAAGAAAIPPSPAATTGASPKGDVGVWSGRNTAGVRCN